MEYLYNCYIIKNIPFINIEGKLAIVDTGSHITLAKSDLSCIKICDRIFYPNHRLYHITIQSLKKFVGFDFDIILGCDILGEFDVTLTNKFVLFTDLSINIPHNYCILKNYLGVPVISVELDGVIQDFIIDTGSPYNYLVKDCIEESSGEILIDFDTITGFFSSAKFCKRVKICGRSFDLFFGNLPPNKKTILQELSIDGILGSSLLNGFNLSFSFKRGLFSLK